MGHPYRQEQDPPAPPRDVMLPVLVAVGVLAFVGATFAIGFGIWDAHHAPAVAQPAPVPTPTVPPEDPVAPPPIQAAVQQSAPVASSSSRPRVIHRTTHPGHIVETSVRESNDGPAEQRAGPKPSCPAGTYAKVGMLGHWGCCPNGADCD